MNLLQKQYSSILSAYDDTFFNRNYTSNASLWIDKLRSSYSLYKSTTTTTWGKLKTFLPWSHNYKVKQELLYTMKMAQESLLALKSSLKTPTATKLPETKPEAQKHYPKLFEKKDTPSASALTSMTVVNAGGQFYSIEYLDENGKEQYAVYPLI
jgi:hypothetical protein